MTIYICEINLADKLLYTLPKINNLTKRTLTTTDAGIYALLLIEVQAESLAFGPQLC